ncbi:MAG: methyl-accepting chemotaxis protein [Gammaproteobacteria bacterium]|nr:methyl-accepting chemotaxis protein [Gammaproteobacteria bacterium]
MVMTCAILMLSGSVLFYIVTEIRNSDAVINGVIEDQESILLHLAKLERTQKLFDDYHTWLTHMALSWRAESEEQADVTRQELIKVLAEIADADADLVQLIEPNIEPLHKDMIAALDWYIDNNRAEGNKSLAKASTIADRIDQEISQQIDEVRLQLSQATGKLVANNSALLDDALVGLVLSVVFGAFLAIFMSRSITRPIGADPGEVSEVAKQIARGNLQMEARNGSTKKPTGVYAAIVAMKTKLTEVMAVLQDVSAQVRRGAAEILQANMSLNKRAEEQASNLERTAASMEEMTATVKQNANNSRQANDLVKDARTEAEHGGLVVKDAVNAMIEISKSSSRIADIIGVIDEIAFQTNLLALNASVEAARAGEQGRGFAVVASEVRALAGRSASAAKEIKVLIEDSVSKVEGGSHLVNETGQALERIVSSVTKVSEIVGEISVASQEQASGIEQVNHAVMRMEDMTQQNAALVEEVTAACMSLGDKAAILDKSVSFFRISENVERRSEDEFLPDDAKTASRNVSLPRPLMESQSKPVKSTRYIETDPSAAKDLWEEF